MGTLNLAEEIESNDEQIAAIQRLQANFEAVFNALDANKSSQVNGNTIKRFSNPVKLVESARKEEYRSDGIFIEPTDDGNTGFTLNLNENDYSDCNFMIYEVKNNGSLRNLPFAGLNLDGTLANIDQPLVETLNTRLEALLTDMQKPESINTEQESFRSLVERVLSK